MNPKSLAPLLCLPMIAMGSALEPIQFDAPIDQSRSTGTTESHPSPDPFGEGWIYVFFPGFGTFPLSETTEEGTFAWNILQAFGGSFDGFEYVLMKTNSPSDINEGVIVFMPTGYLCSSDFNHDGGVDLFDIFDFLDALSAGDQSADLNGDGEVGYFDLIEFLDGYAGGC